MMPEVSLTHRPSVAISTLTVPKILWGNSRIHLIVALTGQVILGYIME